MTTAKKITMKDRFEICPGCGYENGFHIILIHQAKTRNAAMKFQLKCPSCARTYDFNLHAIVKA
jgi:hypothetical protein